MEEKIDFIKDWLGSGSLNIFGIPFAGKDTQGRLLAEMFGGELVAGGDVLRHYPDQTKLKELLSTGELIPTEVYMDVVLPFMMQEKFNGKPLILSSVGRMDGEQETILEAGEKSSHPTKAVVMLNLDDDEVNKRFEAAKELNDRGERADDDEEVLKTRLKEFHEKTQPVVDFYREKGLLIDIDGSVSRDQVTEAIINALYERATA